MMKSRFWASTLAALWVAHGPALAQQSQQNSNQGDSGNTISASEVSATPRQAAVNKKRNVLTKASARMGAARLPGDSDISFSSRIRIDFTAFSKTEDERISFGALVRADRLAATRDVPDSDSKEFLGEVGKAGFIFLVIDQTHKFFVGNIPPAIQFSLVNPSGVGYTGLDNLKDTLFLTGRNDPTVVYSRSFEGDSFGLGDAKSKTSFYLSVEDPEVDGEKNSAFSAGVKVEIDEKKYTIGMGYERNDAGASQVGIGLGAKVDLNAGSSVELKAVYVRRNNTDDKEDQNQYRISADYGVGDWNTTAFVAEQLNDTTDYGLGMVYKLGDGVSIHGGVVHDDSRRKDETGIDLGLRFEF